MGISDPIGDFLTRLRNASKAGLPEVVCPGSREKAASSPGLLPKVPVAGLTTSLSLRRRLQAVALAAKQRLAGRLDQ